MAKWMWLCLSLLCSQACWAEIQISGLADFNFNDLTPGIDKEIHQDFCVYSSEGMGYRLTLTGSGPQQDFSLVGNSQLHFLAFWNDNKGEVRGVPMQAGQAYVFANISREQYCPAGNNASLTIAFLGTELAKAKAGSYQGDITLLLEPM